MRGSVLLSRLVPNLDVRICLLLMLGGGLRFFFLTHQSLWWDEIYIAQSLHLGTWENLQYLWYNENHPPLYILTLKGWVGLFGYSEYSMRAMSAVLGIVTIYLVFLLGRLFYDYRIGLVAAALFCISPLAIYYSQEVRYYALWLPLTSLSFYYFFQWAFFFRKTNGLWAIFTILALFSHIYSLLVLLTQFVVFMFEVVRRRRQGLDPFPERRSPIFLLVTSLGVLILPLFMWWILLHRGHGAGFARPFMLADYLYVFYSWTVGFSLGPSINELHLMTLSQVADQYGYVVIPSLLVILSIFSVGINQAWRNVQFRPLWIVFGICLIFIVSTPAFSKVAFNVRSTLFLVPFFYGVMGLGVLQLWRGYWRLVPAVLVILMIVSLTNYYFNPKYYRDDLRGAAKILESRMTVPVISTPMSSQAALGFYYQNKYQLFGDFDGQDVMNFAHFPKLWLVWNRVWTISHADRFQEYFKRHYRIIEEHDLPGVRLQLVEPRTNDVREEGVSPQ